MGLRGEAAIVGFHELPCERIPTGKPEFTIEQWARLAAAAVADAGLSVEDVDGLVTTGVFESNIFVPSTVVDYLGLKVNFAEYVDLGGASAAAMVWRAAAAIELGICEAVLCAIPARFLTPTHPDRPLDMTEAMYYGASSIRYGSPQAEFEIPYGYLGQNGPYAQVAQMYGAAYGYDERAMAKIVVDQRVNANHTPGAVFHDKPVTVDDVLASPLIADPLHMLEIVMPCMGGSAVLITDATLARRSRNRPVWIKGFGEQVPYKSPVYAENPLRTPMSEIGPKAFGMAGLTPADMDMVSIYDCYTITALLTLEDAGFCGKGEAPKFVDEHDFTYKGDFPLNTHGGQLSFGQSGIAGGMSHVTEAYLQMTGRAGDRQLSRCDTVFVNGNGGIMSEQVSLVL